MRKFISIFICAFLIASTAFAQAFCPLEGGAQPKPKEVASLEVFRKLAILDEGRLKPVETYAQNFLLRLSGRRSYNGEPAVRWFARYIFAPEVTVEDKIFLINNPQLLNALGVEPDKKRRYSFSQLQAGFPKLAELAMIADGIENKSRTEVETEIIRVYENLRAYSEHSYVFKFAFPHPDFTIASPKLKSELDLPAGQSQFSFLDVALRAELMRLATESLSQKSSDKWTADQKKVIGLVTNLYQWSAAYKDLPFKVVPSSKGNEEMWFSPWDSITEGFKTKDVRQEVTMLQKAMVAYWNGEQLDFDMALKSFNDSVAKRVSLKQKKNVDAIPLELFYNKSKLFSIASVCYGVVFLIFLLFLNSTNPFYRRLSLGLLLAGFGAHILALIIRIIIMARPPVTNLYETFIFVGAISVLLGLLIEKRSKKWLGIVVASVCGFVFLAIAGKFSAEGDTLKVLVAVLNSNFWLSTHVLSITIGYAGCCVAGVVGHVYLLQSAFRPKNKALIDSTYRNLIGILGFGLTMAFLGTNLGGIWADQSWGRFWGWDPKENGALLIIIWTAIIFHAKIAKMINKLGVAIGSVLGIIVVMWAWFGVNLLSVGLHSYGFTSGLARNLLIYVICQLLFLTIIVPMAMKHQKV